MPLQLLPMVESDLRAYGQLMWEATRYDLGAVLFPNGYSDADREFGVQSELKDWRKHSDEVKMMKVIDTDLPADHPFGGMVSMSKWKVYYKERTEEEMEQEMAEREGEGLPPGMNAAFYEAFFSDIGKCKKEIMGTQPFVYLNILMTLPDYHRKGAGAMQLRWGNDLADELHLPCYLEASPIGRPLYERMGYKFVRALSVDVRQWGHGKEIPGACLLRPARAANGQAS